MMHFLAAASKSAFGVALLLGFVLSDLAFAAGEGKHANAVAALERDLTVITPGVPPTDAQVQVLSADLGKLFRKVNAPPTVTLEFVAGALAAAASQGQLLADDVAVIVPEVVDLVVNTAWFNKAAEPALEADLEKAGLDPSGAQQLAAAVRALSYDRQSFTVGSTRELILHAVDRTVPGYKHISGYVEFDDLIGSKVVGGVVTDPYFILEGFTVFLTQLPLGKYRVSVTTTARGEPIELGTVRVRPGSFISEDAASGGDQSPSRSRSGSAGFGTDPYGSTPLPTGLSADDVVSLTVVDEQGTPRMTGSFADASFRPSTTHSAQGCLTATTAAPTAGGHVSALADDNPTLQFNTLLLSAVGLPANVSLTFSINDGPGAPVTTGPTGNLYIKTTRAAFPLPPKATEIVNVLPDPVDLSTATKFVVSNAQGNVLLSSPMP